MPHLEKIRKYCAYSERCHSEVRSKLIELSIYGTELDAAIAQLIEEGFLNEERFAKSYCRGKFKNNQWGRNKIKQALKMKAVSEYCIKKGMAEINDDEYLEVLERLLEKKQEALRGERNIWIKKKKIASFLIQKGYESELVYGRLREMH